MQAPFFAITGRRGRLRSSSPWTIFKGRMEKRRAERTGRRVSPSMGWPDVCRKKRNDLCQRRRDCSTGYCAMGEG